ncbi:uncharacterized protein [Cicer arietinum]|uniref:Uncharacterized protein LOC101514534 isoform X2 n=1 Tax=Cicer arietinum TaxID=3827 RepID=A0A3Q7YH41_CICAR|nr:uncharacterized protein LOC101514534 isoform X2 [Cicer arietinum]
MQKTLPGQKLVSYVLVAERKKQKVVVCYMSQLLGENGRGYELARKLESNGVWRTWLGDSIYNNFAPYLSSPSAWDSFMKTDSSKSTPHIHLQLRVRALLFDKASSTSLSSNPNLNPSLSTINPNFLRLHPDDIYFTLDNNNNNNQDLPTSSNSKNGSRYVDSELPETWYNQVIENYKANKKLAMWDRESSPKRSPVEMASYILYNTNHKKRRVVFKEEQDQVMRQSNGGSLVHGDDVDGEFVFPEVTYAWNCVPESAIPVSERVENNNSNQKVTILGVLDALPPVMIRSPVMIERLGIRAEYVNGEPVGGLYRGKLGSEGNGRVLGREQAAKLSQKVVAGILLGAGVEATMEGPIEYLSEVMSKHLVKIGTNLKILADSYKKQCSAIELLKMLLKTVGFSNFAPLVDVVKDGSKNIQQGQQHALGIQSQLQPQQQNSLRLPQQVQMQRQMHPQMQQMIHSQTLAFQQQQQQLQLERMRSHQSPAHPAMDVSKERPLVQVKIENTSDLPSDGNAFNSRHPQMQFRQQQLAAMANFHPQSNTQFRQISSLQIPPMQSQNNISMVRAPPVKVEGFSELMGGGDSTAKHDSEENRMTSPSGK